MTIPFAQVPVSIGSRRLHITAATPNPNGTFVTQQARNLCYTLDEARRV